MEDKIIIWVSPVITIAGMFIGFFWNAAYQKGVFGTRIDNQEKKLSHLEDNVVYRDTCDANLKSTRDRLSRLETVANGSLKR